MSVIQKPVFVVSIDVEFAWGTCDVFLNDSAIEKIAQEREIIKKVLSLFQEQNIQATWAIVGHLLHKWDQGRTLREIPQERNSPYVQNWFYRYPKLTEHIWYTPDVVEVIQKSTPTQEIGSHSFTHISYGNISDEGVVLADIQLARKTHVENALPFQTFIFPRNVVGRRELLANNGIISYRGNPKRWYDIIHIVPLWRILYFLGYVLRSTPPTSKPYRDEYGLINIPESMLLLGRNGIRRAVSPDVMLRLAKKGIQKAMRRNEVFHLWFHPCNFSDDTMVQLDLLKKILQYAVSLRSSGKLEIMTMGELARKLN